MKNKILLAVVLLASSALAPAGQYITRDCQGILQMIENATAVDCAVAVDGCTTSYGYWYQKELTKYGIGGCFSGQ